jgi:hypothetical protein
MTVYDILNDAVLTQRRSPARSAFGELHERPGLDDAVGAEERQGPPPRIARQRLDDVLREVEAIRDVPAVVVCERGKEGELEW